MFEVYSALLDSLALGSEGYFSYSTTRLDARNSGKCL